MFLLRNLFVTAEFVIYMTSALKIKNFIDDLNSSLECYARKTGKQDMTQLESSIITRKIFFVNRFVILIILSFRIYNWTYAEKLEIFLFEGIERPCILYSSAIILLNTLTIVFSITVISSQEILLPILILRLEKLFHFVTMQVSEITKDFNYGINENELEKFLGLHMNAMKLLTRFKNLFKLILTVRTFSTLIQGSIVVSSLVSLNYIENFNLIQN